MFDHPSYWAFNNMEMRVYVHSIHEHLGEEKWSENWQMSDLKA